MEDIIRTVEDARTEPACLRSTILIPCLRLVDNADVNGPILANERIIITTLPAKNTRLVGFIRTAHQTFSLYVVSSDSEIVQQSNPCGVLRINCFGTSTAPQRRCRGPTKNSFFCHHRDTVMFDVNGRRDLPRDSPRLSSFSGHIYPDAM